MIQESGGLSARVTNEFFSHGQKQLLCIASAMLRKGNILVLDEATSSIDSDTDAIVHSLIRSKCVHHTIIAIAHRLDSILDFDKVIVMDKGKIKESGNPRELLVTPDTAFRDLYLSLNPSFARSVALESSKRMSQVRQKRISETESVKRESFHLEEMGFGYLSKF